MNDLFYKQIIQETPIGYAYHRLISGDSGIPNDCVIQEMNTAFEKMTGLKKDETIGRKLSEIFLIKKGENSDWKSFYNIIYQAIYDSENRQYSKQLIGNKESKESKEISEQAIDEIKNKKYPGHAIGKGEGIQYLDGNRQYPERSDDKKESNLYKEYTIGNKESRQYLEFSFLCFKINIHFPEENYFTMFLTEIKNEITFISELEKFFNDSLDILCITDYEGNFIKVNKAWNTILGYSDVELQNSIG